MSGRTISQGFTLIELMVTLSILAIMLAVGVPSFKNFIGSQKVKSASYEMMTSAVIGRSEAIKRNGNVTITPTTGSSWNSGWSVKSGTTVLHSEEDLSKVGVSVTAYKDGTCTTTASITTITFGSSGRPSNDAAANTSSCFKFSASTTTTTRCVKLDLTGIPSTITCP